MECKATQKTTEILEFGLRMEYAAFAPTQEALNAEFVRYPQMTPAERADLLARTTPAAAVEERVARIFGVNADGTGVGDESTARRNNVGSAIKAVRKFTGRNIMEEAFELWKAHEAAKADA